MDVSVKHIPIDNSFMGMVRQDPVVSNKREQSILLNQRFPDIVGRIKRKLDGFEDMSWVPVCRSKRDLRKLDCISFIADDKKSNVPIFDDYLHNTPIDGTDSFISLPFLNEGVIKYYQGYNGIDDKLLNYIYFKVLDVDVDNRRFKAHLDVYEQAETFIYFLGLDVDCHGDDLSISNFIINEDYLMLAHESNLLTNVEEIAYKSLFSDIDFKSEKYRKEKDGRGSNYCGIFLKVFHRLNKQIQDSYVPKESSSSNRTLTVERKDRKTGKRRVIFLGGPTLTCAKNTKLRFKNGTIERHTMVWGVRGHWRHYKDGRVIYIRPYEKGPERGKAQKAAKEYRVSQELHLL